MNTKLNIFITGGTGFIGQHLIEELGDSFFRIFVLSRKKIRNINNRIQYVHGDLNQMHLFSDILKTIDVFIHIAGEYKDKNIMYDVNVISMQNVLQEVVKYPQIKFIHISSSGVYGIENNPLSFFDEASNCMPGNVYEKTKLESEYKLQEISTLYSLKYTILRPSNVFGEFDRNNKLLNLFKSVKKNRVFYLNNNARLNYVYVKQLTFIIKQIILKDIFYNDTYNVNSSCTVSSFFEEILTLLNIKNEIRQIPSFYLPLLKMMARIADLLPEKFQYFNSGKFREMTDEKYYCTKKINKILSLDEKEILVKGLSNLFHHYQLKKLL